MSSIIVPKVVVLCDIIVSPSSDGNETGKFDGLRFVTKRLMFDKYQTYQMNISLLLGVFFYKGS
jgi:hypothetical protein